jgi:CRISPR-associated protein Csd2
MSCRGLYVFSHNSKLGNAPAHRLVERVTATRRTGVNVPRAFADYVVAVDEVGLPEGITLTALAC